MPGVFLCCLAHQAQRGPFQPWTGVLLYRLVDQTLKRTPCVGSYYVVWCKVYDVPLLMLACGEREAMVIAPPSMLDSAASPCFHGCLAFLHRHFPPQSSPSHPLGPSLHSQQQPSPWDCSTIPMLQAQLLHLLGDLGTHLRYMWL